MGCIPLALAVDLLLLVAPLQAEEALFQDACDGPALNTENWPAAGAAIEDGRLHIRSPFASRKVFTLPIQIDFDFLYDPARGIDFGTSHIFQLEGDNYVWFIGNSGTQWSGLLKVDGRVVSEGANGWLYVPLDPPLGKGRFHHARIEIFEKGVVLSLGGRGVWAQAIDFSAWKERKGCLWFIPTSPGGIVVDNVSVIRLDLEAESEEEAVPIPVAFDRPVSLAVLDARSALPNAGVFGVQGLAEGLKEAPNCRVQVLQELSADSLAAFDCLVVPDTGFGEGEAAEARISRFVHLLPAYVGAGGGLLLLGRSTGSQYPYPEKPSPFPEICEARGDFSFWYLKPADSPLAKGVSPFLVERFGGPWGGDMFIWHQAGEGEVFLTDALSRPVGVAGVHGAGRVVSLGIPAGIARKKDAAEGAQPVEERIDSSNQARLLANLFRWLAGGPEARGRDEAVARWLDEEARLAESRREESAARLRQQVDACTQARSPLGKELLAGVKELERGAQKDLKKLLKDARKLSETEAILRGWRIRESVEEFADRVEALHRRLYSAFGQPGIRFPRRLPPFPRILVYPEGSAANVKTGRYQNRLFLREFKEEAHANAVTSFVQRYEVGSKWVSGNPQIEDLLFYTSVYGLAFLPMMTYRVENRSWPGGPDSFALYRRYPSTWGLVLDEPNYVPWSGHWNEKHPDPTEEFRAWLNRNVSREEMARQGLSGVESLQPPQPSGREADRWLWFQLGRFSCEKILGQMSTIRSDLRRVDPDMHFTLDHFTSPYLTGPFSSPLPEMATACDEMVLTEPYSKGEMRESLWVDLVRAGDPSKKVILGIMPFSWAMDSGLSFRRSLYNSMLRADGVFLFVWEGFSKKIGGWSGMRAQWRPDNWPILCQAFGEMERLEPYLDRTTSTARAGLLVSQNTMWQNYYGLSSEAQNPYFSDLLGWYWLLSQIHVGFDLLFAENLQAESLGRYDLLIAPSAECLQTGHEQLLTRWVEAGGILLATSRTAAHDPWGNARIEPGLQGLFRAGPLSSAGPSPVPAASAPAGDRPAEAITLANHPIWRGMPEARGWTYSAEKQALPRESLRPFEGAEVLGTWPDGDPAIVLSRPGKGLGCLLGTTRLGLSLSPSGKSVVFHSGVLEGVGTLITSALEEQGKKLPWRLEHCPPFVVGNVRRQHEASRLVLHLLSYGEAGEIIRGVQLRCTPPPHWGRKKVVAASPLTGLEIPCAREGSELVLTVPPFDLYAMVVVESR
ncbi:MAG: beta-galactosidase trimerization domain-containing protein [Planctomycetes bacterium]|nr:beta-galactosidase trimerization domain-containing protein [Planctomycetota bacterium]